MLVLSYGRGLRARAGFGTNGPGHPAAGNVPPSALDGVPDAVNALVIPI